MMTYSDIFDSLLHYCRTGYNHLSMDTQMKVNGLASEILQTFHNPEFHLTRDEIQSLLTTNHVLANIIAMTPIGTTDSILNELITRPNTLYKQMILYSVRNKLQLDSKKFFDFDPELASLWFEMFLLPAAGRTSELLYSNSIRHFETLDSRYVPTKRATTLYFLPNYINSTLVPKIKQHINNGFKKIAPIVTNHPSNKIAIVAENWRKGHAVYKSMIGLIRALAEKYPLSLVALGPIDRIDTELFTDVYNVRFDSQLDVSEIQDNDFQVAFFIDVGMCVESIMLSNCRIAPVQIAGHGHPVSTFGSEIDYFITGADVELEPDGPKQRYFEKMFLLPGSGCHPEKPNYNPKYPKIPDSPIIINVPWGVAKYNYPILQLLRQIQEDSKKKVFYRFFPGCGLDRYNCAWPYFKDMNAIFGAGAEYIPNKSYNEYMECLENGNFSLDNYPFGSYNCIVDSLWIGKPIVTLEGNEWYNRVGSYVLRTVGLNELVTTSKQEYVIKVKQLVEDNEYRNSLTEKIKQADLSVLFENDEPKHFVKAIEQFLV